MWMTALVSIVLGLLVTHANAATCTDAEAAAIGKKLAVRWKSTATVARASTPTTRPYGAVWLEGPNTSWIDLACVAGSFGKAGYFIDALDNRFVGDNRIMVRHRLIVTRDGTVLAAAPDTEDVGRQLEHELSYRGLDLDGDGIDEVLVTDHFQHTGLAMSRTVLALAVRAGKVVELGKITIESGGKMWPSCRAAKFFDERAGKATRLVLIFGTSPPDCPKAGKHLYGVVGDKLVEVGPDGKPLKTP